MSHRTQPEIEAILLQEIQDNLNLAQAFHIGALAGHFTTLGLAIAASTLVCTGNLDPNIVLGSASTLTTLPLIATTRALTQARQHLREECDRLCQHLNQLK
jgi:hypothetical protein